MIIDRRAFLAATAAATTLPSRLLAATGPVLRPEDFGARGDGVTNDTRAFAALSAEVNRRGGGTIALRAGRTYVVGEQGRGDKQFGWNPSPILEFQGLTRPLSIIGNGARLLGQAGLRYGTFDRGSGAPVQHQMPYYVRADLATPYRAMILAQGCRALIELRDIELDGNLERLRIGGKFGDKGWQIPCTGLFLRDNSAAEIISNVVSHHQALDGATIIGGDRSARSHFSRFAARYNGRQGISITGGRGYDFEDCEFSHTGRSAVRSAPGAGVDIEAEKRTIRDLTFTRCRFVDNVGCGMLADTGDSEGVKFTECLFVGTTSWSAWPKKPGFSFAKCTFVGAVVHPFSDKDPARAAHFTACHFTDSPKLSPTGEVYLGNGPIVNMATSENVLFEGCTFDLVAAGALPWSWGATYRDCTMRQRSPKTGMPKGRYLGRNTIDGKVDLYGSMIQGVVILNGKVVKRGPVGRDVKPW